MYAVQTRYIEQIHLKCNAGLMQTIRDENATM